MDSGHSQQASLETLTETLDIGKIPQSIWTNSEVKKPGFPPQVPVGYGRIAIISSM